MRRARRADSSNCGTAGGDILKHDTHRPDTSPISDVNAAKHLRISPQVHIIAKHRHRPTCNTVSNRDPLSQRAARPDYHSRIYEDVAKVEYPQTRPNLSFTGQADASQSLHKPEHEPI